MVRRGHIPRKMFRRPGHTPRNRRTADYTLDDLKKMRRRMKAYVFLKKEKKEMCEKKMRPEEYMKWALERAGMFLSFERMVQPLDPSRRVRIVSAKYFDEKKKKWVPLPKKEWRNEQKKLTRP